MQIPSSTLQAHHTPSSTLTGKRKFDVTVSTDLPEEIFAELRRPLQSIDTASPSKSSFDKTLSTSAADVNERDTPTLSTYGTLRQKPAPSNGLGTLIDVIA